MCYYYDLILYGCNVFFPACREALKVGARNVAWIAKLALEGHPGQARLKLQCSFSGAKFPQQLGSSRDLQNTSR